MQSEQERFVRTLMTHSFGAPFLFEPDEYDKSKGSGRRQPREPADLAWWCRDSMFLISMTESKCSADEAADHNFRQLRGWMRAWSAGRNLTGTNEFGSFEVALDQVDQLVLMSVNNDPAGTAWVELEPSRESNCSLIRASLPQVVLERLAEMAGGALDLADLLLQLSIGSERFSAPEAIALLEEQRENGVRAAVAHPHISGEREYFLDKMLEVNTFNAIRACAAETLDGRGDNPEEIGMLSAIFNDFDWESSCRFTFRLADLVREVRDFPTDKRSMFISQRLDLGPYLFLLTVSRIDTWREALDRTMNLREKIIADQPSRPLIQVTGLLANDEVTPIFAIEPHSVSTLTREALAAIAQGGT